MNATELEIPITHHVNFFQGCNKWSDFQQSGAPIAAIFIDDGFQLLQTKLQKYGFIVTPSTPHIYINKGVKIQILIKSIFKTF